MKYKYTYHEINVFQDYLAYLPLLSLGKIVIIQILYYYYYFKEKKIRDE